MRQRRPVPASVEERLADKAVAGPIERHSLDCRPLFGLSTCPGEAER